MMKVNPSQAIRVMGTDKLLVIFSLALASAAPAADIVLPSVAANLVCHYDFDHPLASDAGRERDLGTSGTAISLVNGGRSMRVEDIAYPGAGLALQTRQVDPGRQGNDDWKAGIYDAEGVGTLDAFSAVAGITLMGWIKPVGEHPGLDSTTEDPDDRFGAVGLFGLLSGTSEGHLVRALIEVMQVGDSLRLVALGRRIDNGTSLVLAADENWDSLLRAGTWTHIAATFDYDNGTMALYRNGKPVPASYTAAGDVWEVAGDPEPDLASVARSRGIKIGGSYPQNTQERNPFNGRFDDLMFFDRVLTAGEIRTQFQRFHETPSAE